MSERGPGPACEWHEERISRNEASLSEVAAQMAALSEQIKNVAEKVEGVGDRLGGSIADLRTDNKTEHEAMRAEVTDLKAKQEEHGKSLALLLGDRAAAEKRMAGIKSAGGAIALAALAAIATKWGEAIWEWFFKGRA